MAETSSENINLTQKTRLFISRIDHSSKIMNTIDDIFEKQLFTDVCLSCENQIINAHRLILAAASSFFYSLFSTQPCCIAPNPVVVIRDTRINELKAILDFIYYGQVAVQESEVDSLVKSAQTLGVYGLAQIDLKKIDEVKRDDDPIETITDALPEPRPEPVISTTAAKKVASEQAPKLTNQVQSKAKEKQVLVQKERNQMYTIIDKSQARVTRNDDPATDEPNLVLDPAAEAKKKLAEVAQRLMSHSFVRNTDPPGLLLPDEFEPSNVSDALQEPEVPSNFIMDDKQLDDHLRLKRKRLRGGVSLLKNGNSTGNNPNATITAISNTNSNINNNSSNNKDYSCGGNGDQANSSANSSPSVSEAGCAPKRQSLRISKKKKNNFGDEPNEKKCKSSSLSNFPIYRPESPESVGIELETGRLSPTPSDSSLVRSTKKMRKIKNYRVDRSEKLKLIKESNKQAGKLDSVGSEDEMMSIVNAELDNESLDDHQINILMAEADPGAYEINNNTNNDSNTNINEQDEQEGSSISQIPIVKKRRSSCTLPVSGRSSTCSSGQNSLRDKQSKKHWKDGTCSEVSESDTDESHNSRVLSSTKRMLMLSKYQAVSLLADGGSGVKITKSNAKLSTATLPSSGVSTPGSSLGNVASTTRSPPSIGITTTASPSSSHAITSSTRKKVN